MPAFRVVVHLYLGMSVKGGMLNRAIIEYFGPNLQSLLHTCSCNLHTQSQSAATSNDCNRQLSTKCYLNRKWLYQKGLTRQTKVNGILLVWPNSWTPAVGGLIVCVWVSVCVCVSLSVRGHVAYYCSAHDEWMIMKCSAGLICMYICGMERYIINYTS